MSLSNHPCWVTAMHEASHIAVFLKLGGQWGASGKSIRIQPFAGAVELGGLSDYKYGYFLDYCVYAAGVAADRIQGVYSCVTRGSDMHALRDLAIDYKLTTTDIDMVITGIEKWLRKHNKIIEFAAEQLIIASDIRGNVPRTRSNKIVKVMIEKIPRRRELVKRR